MAAWPQVRSLTMQLHNAVILGNRVETKILSPATEWQGQMA